MLQSLLHHNVYISSFIRIYKRGESIQFGFYNDKGKEDISLLKIFGYLVLFIIPLFFAYFLSNFIATLFQGHLNVSSRVAAEILMMFLTLIIFFFLVPFVRVREGIRGVRFSLFLFLIISLLMTIPPIYKGYYNFLFIQFVYIANFILATFLNCPDVIGISGDTENWFKHKVQLMILLIYTSIVLFYIMGFAWMYYEVSLDPEYPNAFIYTEDITPSYSTFLYYSIITFATVGYGDITPLSPAARLVAGLEVLLAMIINVVFIAILLVFVGNFSLLEEKLEQQRIRSEERKIEREEVAIEHQADRIAEEEHNIEQDLFRIRAAPEQTRTNQTFSQMQPRTSNVTRYPNYLNGEENQRQ